MPSVKGYTSKRGKKNTRAKPHLRNRREEQRGGVGVLINNIPTASPYPRP